MSRRNRRPPPAQTPLPETPSNIVDLKTAAARTIEQSRLDRLENIVSRQDRWVNPLTGLGTFKDKTRHGFFEQPIRLTDVEITSLASGNHLAAKAIEKRPFEMFRRGYTLEAEGGDDAGIDKSAVDELRKYAIEQLKLDERMRQGMVFGRQYGGALLLLGIDDGRNPWEPVDEKNIKSLNFINQLDRRFAYVQSYYSNYMSPNYGEPETYLVANAVATSTYRSSDNTTFRVKRTQSLPSGSNYAKSPSGGYSILNVHESRVIRFDGVEPDVLTRQILAGWSWSILQRAYETLRQCDMGFDALAYLIADASQGVMKLKGLLAGLSVPGQRQAVEQRMEMIDQQRSVMRSIAVDPSGGEDFTRVTTPLTGIPDSIDRLMQLLAAAFDMPVTELFGTPPTGLNATGENDRIHWYDTIATDQENVLAPRLKRVYRLLSLAKEGPLEGKDLNWKVKFNPLHTPTDAEIATVRFTNAQRDNLYLTQQVVSAEEVAVTLSDVYPHLDIESREKMIDQGKSFDHHPNDPEPDPTGGAGGSGDIGEGQSPTVPLPGSAIHASVAPAGEGRGTPGDAGTGSPTLKAGQKVVLTAVGKPATANAASAKGVPGTKPTPGKPKPAAKDDRQDAGVPHMVVPKGGGAPQFHGSKRSALEHVAALSAAGQAANLMTAEEFARSASAKLPPRHATGKFTARATLEPAPDPASTAEAAALPADFGVAVPKAGSHCANCKYLVSEDPPTCGNKTFSGWVKLRTGQGTGEPPAPIPTGDANRYCCSAWEAAPGVLKGDASDVGAAAPVLTPAPDPQPAPLPAASIGIIRNGNRVLVVRASKGWRGHIWALPGGTLEPNETPEATLRRELAEEVGIVATDIEHATDILCPTDGRTVHVFYVKSYQGEIRPDRDEVRSIRWMMPVGLMGASGRWYKSVHQLILNGVLGGKAEMDGPAGPVGRMLAAAFEAAGLTAADMDGSASFGSMTGVHNTKSHAADSQLSLDLGVVDSIDHWDSADIAEDVYAQLAPDYPEEAIAWVKAVPWKGPKTVPLEKIDFSGRAHWKAAHDDLSSYEEKVRNGQLKPIILVKRPSSKLLFDADGHHRLLTYEKMARPPLAYIALVKKDTGPWDQMHALQKSGMFESAQKPGKDGDGTVGKKDADWDESKHPRSPNGQFGEGGGSEGGTPKAGSSQAPRVFTDTPPKGSTGDTMRDNYKDGKPTAERKASVHDPIVHAAIDSVEKPPAGAPKVAYFTMGPPGSGKSAGLRNIDQSKFVRVDPDAIKEQLPEFKAATSDRSNTYRNAAAMVHEEASDVAKRVMNEAIASGKHILVDGTGVNADSMIRKMEAARAAGYHVHLAYSHLGDEQEGARRIAARADKTGRTVPADFVHKAYEAVPKNFAEVAKHADTFDVHDTSKPGSPTVWSKSPEGEHLVDPEFVRGFKEKYQGGATGARQADPKEFKEAFDKAFKDDPHSGFVSHYSESQLAGMKTYLSADGKTGIAVHDHGDGRIEGTALFNKGGPPGAGKAILDHAIKEGGVNYLECFGDVLRGKYESLGFKVDTKSAFDPQYAPKNWDYEKFGRPDYYTLSLPKKDSGDWDESKHPRSPNGQFGEGGSEGANPKAASSPVEEAKSLAESAMKETSLDARNRKLQDAIDSLPGAPRSVPGEDPLMGARSEDSYEARSLDRLGKVPIESKSAITAWTGHAYDDIRRYEADPAGYEKDIAKNDLMPVEDVKRIDERLQHVFDTAAPTPGIVYRGVSCALPTEANRAAFEKNGINDDAKRLHALLTNDTIRLRTTASSSRSAETGMDFAKRGQVHVVLRLNQKSGVAIEPLSQNRGEREILLKKGTTYKITNRAQSAGYLIIDADEV